MFALLPWWYATWHPHNLIPVDLREGPELYQQTVQAAQNATVDASRQITSVAQVNPVKTIMVTVAPEQVVEPIQGTPIVIISTVSQNEEASPTNTLTTEDLTATTTSANPEAIAFCALSEDEYIPATPSILNDVNDTLTDGKITEQLLIDAGDSDFHNIQVFLNEGGIHITSVLTVLPGINQEVKAQGVFTVQQYSLRIVLSSITSDGMDVTSQYCKSLQTRLNTSLYRLLPERYVQDFDLFAGEIVVYSKIRP